MQKSAPTSVSNRAILEPGDPAPNAPKWFCAVEIIRLATDKDWLHKATKEISKYWQQKRAGRVNPQPVIG